MKIALAILLLVAVALGWRLSTELATSRQQREQIQQLTAKLADTSKRDHLELQAKCVAQAERVFHVLGYHENSQGGSIDIYQSHYHPALYRCFMAITTSDLGRTIRGVYSETRFLFDVYEQLGYGEFTSIKSKAIGPQPFIGVCKLTPLSAPEQRCKSEEEYQAFVIRFME